MIGRFTKPSFSKWSRADRAVYIGLGFLLVAALIVYLKFRLPGLWPDEAENGLDALAVSRGERSLSVFYESNGGREGLHVALIALAFKIFGPSVYVLRAVSVAGGLLFSVAFAMLAREGAIMAKLTRWQQGAIMMTGLIVVLSSHWLAYFAHIGFRVIWGVFLLTAAVALFLSARRTGLKLLWALSGAAFALSLYTYLALRVVAPVLALSLVVSTLRDFKDSKTYKSLGIFVASGIAIISPLVIYFIQNPEKFNSRTGSVSVFSEGGIIGNILASFVKIGAMFVFTGDGNLRHNYLSVPQIALVLIPFFIVGILLRRGMKSIESKRLYSLTALWMAIGLIPALLSVQAENPHALRAILAMPPALLFVTAGLAYVHRWLALKFDFMKASAVIFAVLLCSVIQLGYIQNQLIKRGDIKHSFTTKQVVAADAIAKLMESNAKVVYITNDPDNAYVRVSLDFVLRSHGRGLEDVDIIECQESLATGSIAIYSDCE